MYILSMSPMYSKNVLEALYTVQCILYTCSLYIVQSILCILCTCTLYSVLVQYARTNVIVQMNVDNTQSFVIQITKYRGYSFESVYSV